MPPRRYNNDGGGGRSKWNDDGHDGKGGQSWKGGSRDDGDGGHGGKGGKHSKQSPSSANLEETMRTQGIDQAWQVLEDMLKRGQKSDRFTVSRMLMRTVSGGHCRWQPQKVYRGLAIVEKFIEAQPSEADEVLFNALLDTCCRMKDLEKLGHFMQRMEEFQITPSHVTLGILVKAYGQAGDVQRVLKVWDDMVEQRSHANAVTFGCMIDACVKCGCMTKAMEIFRDMKAQHKHRNTILYTTLVKGYGLEKDLKNALELFREMQAEGVPYNTITYNSIIDVCIKCCDVATAESLLHEMLNNGHGVEPDLITYSTLLKGYCHFGDLDRALQVAATIKDCGLTCDELVYNTLMDGCVKANDLSAGIGLFAEMTQAGMQPSSITHSILLRLYQHNGYKGDCMDAVAKLYQHHGVEKPFVSGSTERAHRSRRNNNDKREGGQEGGKGEGKGGYGANGYGKGGQGAQDAVPIYPSAAPVVGDASSRVVGGGVSRAPGRQQWRAQGPQGHDAASRTPPAHPPEASDREVPAHAAMAGAFDISARLCQPASARLAAGLVQQMQRGEYPDAMGMDAYAMGDMNPYAYDSFDHMGQMMDDGMGDVLQPWAIPEMSAAPVAPLSAASGAAVRGDASARGIDLPR
eukprot:TRINITY_DN819_c0_g6_i1.p1 TRINITY_DN819_c0_g6~~TRINITY_DN819_c0_g6_i1.p1  ORF type:complete len:633 (-),score=129.09 TRINITY_DN819_c0_g6_i1:163-2061(-)